MVQIEILWSVFDWTSKQQLNLLLFLSDCYCRKLWLMDLPGHNGKVTSDKKTISILYEGYKSGNRDYGSHFSVTFETTGKFLMTPLHAGWLVDFYNHMTSGAEKKVIDNGWTSSGIKGAIALGLDSLPSVDLFHDIAPIIADPSGSQSIPNHAVYDLSPETKSIG